MVETNVEFETGHWIGNFRLEPGPPIIKDNNFESGCFKKIIDSSEHHNGFKCNKYNFNSRKFLYVYILILAFISISFTKLFGGWVRRK